MAGRMGGERVTIRSIDVVEIDSERNLLLVKGPVPGPNRGLVFIRDAKRLYRSKAKAASENSGEVKEKAGRRRKKDDKATEGRTI